MHSMPINIKGNRVWVKNMPAGTKFITLDGVERTLEAGDHHDL
jgi:hypothetical protein